jgi:small subunit ribosomal protein S10
MVEIRIKLKSFDFSYIENFIKKLYELLLYLNIYSVYWISLPTLKKKLTVIRSPHIDKKSREQFEFIRYKTEIIIQSKKSFNTSFFLYFLKNSEASGVQLQISIKYYTYLV